MRVSPPGIAVAIAPPAGVSRIISVYELRRPSLLVLFVLVLTVVVVLVAVGLEEAVKLSGK